ncbi:MAG: RecB family exonuclease [Patescibacteria group bacterium]
MNETQIIKTSYSALDTFRQCPLKYKFMIIDKIKAPKTKEAVFGDKLHKALQFFHSKSPVSPTLDELLNYIKEIWPARNASLAMAGGESPFNESEDLIYFSEAIKILKGYYENYTRIKDKFAVLDTETRFEVLLENPANKDQKCLLAGIIDRVDKIKDGIEVIDYKTTKRFPSQDDVNSSLQLSLYCIGVLNRWPEFTKYGPENIKLTLYYLKHQETISTKRSKEQLDNVQRQAWELLAEIEKSEFQPIPSALCDWCGYRRLCPMWKHLYKEQFTLDDQQIKKIIDEFFELKQTNSKNNKRINELKEIIEGYLNKEKIERVFGELGYITRLPQIRYEYDMEKVKALLEPFGKWYDVLGIDPDRLKIIIKTLPPNVRKEIEKAKKIDKEYTIIKASVKKVKKESTAS